MSLEHLRKTLIQAARAQQPSDAVPYAFEQRVMARLRQSSRPLPTDPLLDWAHALFRAALPCLVATLLVAAWNVHHNRMLTQDSVANESNLVTQELAMAVIDSIDAPGFGEELP